MSHKLLIFAAMFSALAFVACDGGNRAPEQQQEQVTSPALTDREPGIDDMIEVDEFPSPTKRVNPVYPEEARKNGVQGIVYVKVLVDKKGNVTKAVVTKRTDGSASMEQAALDAVKEWTFKPATVNNQPVDIWVAIPFKFKLATEK